MASDAHLDSERMRWWWVKPPPDVPDNWEWAWYCWRSRELRRPKNGNTERLEAIKARVRK